VRRRIVLLAVASFSLGFLIGSGTSPAVANHIADSYYARAWPIGNNQDIAAGVMTNMTGNTSTLSKLGVIDWAGNKWDAVSGASDWGSFTYTGHYLDHTDVVAASSPCDYELVDHDVFVVSAKKGEMNKPTSTAEAQRCVVGTKIVRGLIRARRNPPGVGIVWYYPANKPTPGGQFNSGWKSFAGVMVTELGHITGFGSGSLDHLGGSPACDDSPAVNTDSTMCGPGAPQNHTAWYYSTLDSHDQSVFRAAY